MSCSLAGANDTRNGRFAGIRTAMKDSDAPNRDVAHNREETRATEAFHSAIELEAVVEFA